jgi:hypothetical protein
MRAAAKSLVWQLLQTAVLAVVFRSSPHAASAAARSGARPAVYLGSDHIVVVITTLVSAG